MANTRAKTKKPDKTSDIASKASTPRRSGLKSKPKKSPTEDLENGSEVPSSVVPRIKLTFKGEETQSTTGSTTTKSKKKTKKEPKPPTNNNLFGVQDCPVFFPSEEQFTNPHQFINSILPVLEKYGMCKVQPPSSWDPDFAPDLKEYKFKTQVQKLNLTGIKARLSSSFKEKSKLFYEMTQLPLKTPIFYNKLVEMGRFKEQVEVHGGYESVTINKKWSQVGRALGYEPRECTSLSFGLRTMYESNISPLKFYLDLAECIIHNEETSKQAKSKSDANIPMIEGFVCKLCKIKEPPKKDKVFAAMNVDIVVGKLTCTTCSTHYHKKCFAKHLGLLPPNEFYCPVCIYSYTPVFGFDYGAEYKLPEFMLKAERFKKQYYKDKVFPQESTPAQEEAWIEKNYWGQIEETANEVSVESGAEISAAFHGSGFPSKETNNTSKYSGHPWNFIKLTNDPNNLLSHLRNKNTGMAVPWIYVGMLFSTFCWHSEDHNTFTLNYHHWGDPKTYYCIPAAHAHKLLETLKEIAPHVLESEPDLLSQLITMISPEDLIKRGIPVYKSTQRHGQFIITMPQVFHCNFSHGFNFTESINYAPYSWLPFGQKAIDDYKILKQEPLFSHQELILNAADSAVNKHQAFALIPLLEQIKQSIQTQYDQCRQLTKNIRIELHPKNVNPTEIPCCTECKSICFLMSVGCTRCVSKKPVCVEHLRSLCSCPLSLRKLLIYVENAAIDYYIEKLTNLTNMDESWLNSYKVLIAGHRYPNVEDVSRILKLTKEMGVVREEVGLLNDFYTQCLKWNGQADRFLQKYAMRDSNRFVRFVTAAELNDTVNNLLADYEKLSFSSPSGTALKTYVDYIINIRGLIESYMKKESKTSADYDTLLLTVQGSALSEEEIANFTNSFKKVPLYDDLVATIASLERGSVQLTLTTACEILAKLDFLGVGKNDLHYQRLEKLIVAGKEWAAKVNPVLSGNGDYQPSYLQELVDQASKIPHDPELVTLLQLRKSHTDLPRSRKTSFCPDPTKVERSMSLPRKGNNYIENVEVWLATCKHVLFINVPDKSQSLQSRLEYLITYVFRMIDDPTVDVCICMTVQSYRQITCTHCKVSYHKTCLGARKNFLNKDPYLCPMCDPTSKGPIVKKRPTLLGLERLLADGAPFASELEVYKLLAKLVQKLKDFAQVLMLMLKENSIPRPVDEFWSRKLSYNLRILHGLEIYLAPQTKELTKVLHMQPKKDLEEQNEPYRHTSIIDQPTLPQAEDQNEKDQANPEDVNTKIRNPPKPSNSHKESETPYHTSLPLPSEFSPKRLKLSDIQLSYSLEASLATSKPITIQPGPVGSSHFNRFQRKLSQRNNLYDGAEFEIKRVLLQESSQVPQSSSNLKNFEDNNPFSIASLLGRPLTPPHRPTLMEPKVTVINPNFIHHQHHHFQNQD